MARLKYNFHIHSCLSPCADDDMTPVNIVAYAKLNGIDAIAIADHNAIENVEVALMAGEAFEVCVVPAIEVQTEEDIHVLCLFPTFGELKAFWESIKMTKVKNRPSVFGNQLVVNEEDEVVGTLEDLLLINTDVGAEQIHQRAMDFGGVAIPAHIDREGNGMLAILGIIPDEFGVVELSYSAGETIERQYQEDRLVIKDSDAHTLMDIGEGQEMDVDEISPKGIVETLRRFRKKDRRK